MLDPKLVEAARTKLTKPRKHEEEFSFYGIEEEDEGLTVADQQGEMTAAIADSLDKLPGCCGVGVLNGFAPGPLSEDSFAATVLVLNECNYGRVIAVTAANQAHAEKALQKLGFRSEPFVGRISNPLKMWTLDLKTAPTPKKAATRRR